MTDNGTATEPTDADKLAKVNAELAGAMQRLNEVTVQRNNLAAQFLNLQAEFNILQQAQLKR